MFVRVCDWLEENDTLHKHGAHYNASIRANQRVRWCKQDLIKPVLTPSPPLCNSTAHKPACFKSREDLTFRRGCLSTAGRLTLPCHSKQTPAFSLQFYSPNSSRNYSAVLPLGPLQSHSSYFGGGKKSITYQIHIHAFSPDSKTFPLLKS